MILLHVQESTLIAWAITAGYLWPSNEKIPSDDSNWQNEALVLLKNKKWTWNKFIINKPDLFKSSEKIKIQRTLTYKSMTKNTKALREKGQDRIRNATLHIESKLKNRRFALLYILALCANDNKKLNLKNLLKELLKYPDMFVINRHDFVRVMISELEQMSITSGIVFSKIEDNLIPMVSCNLNYLKCDAPEDLVDLLNKIYKNI